MIIYSTKDVTELFESRTHNSPSYKNTAELLTLGNCSQWGFLTRLCDVIV